MHMARVNSYIANDTHLCSETFLNAFKHLLSSITLWELLNLKLMDVFSSFMTEKGFNSSNVDDLSCLTGIEYTDKSASDAANFWQTE